MSDLVIQPSFNAGEWSPKLYARVDLAKYRSGAALLENFFIDYRGGATTRAGTRYVLQCRDSTAAVRLISFQASFTVNYVLEFGNQYVRFFNNGAPVLETSKTITGITQANPAVATSNAHGYSNGDWVYISNVAGMTQVNGNYYIVAGVTANTFQLTDLNGVNVNSTGYGAYTSGGTAQRVYTLTSPYLASELAQLKFSQNVNTMILCHPNRVPYQLVLNTATNWTLSAITFGATITAPTGLGSQSNVAGTGTYYGYVVTSVDANGQESAPSTIIAVSNTGDLRTTAGSITVSWTVVPTTAVSYNVYKAPVSYAGAVAATAMFGFIGNTRGLSFTDANITPDFSQPPPVPQSPFSGSGVASLTLTAGGSYSVVPNVNLTAAPVGGTTATASAQLGVNAAGSSISDAGRGYVVGQLAYFPYGVIIQVLSVDGIGAILTWQLTSAGSLSSGPTPTNPVTSTGSNVSGFPSGIQRAASFNFNWTVNGLTLITPGTGYLVTPNVTFTPAGATATATLGASAAGNPAVPGFFQQRLVMAGPAGNPQQFNISQPGSIYNFNTTDPILPDNAIQGSLVSGQLNNIKALIPQPQGLIILSDKQAWLLNGGSAGAPISAISLVANPQAYNGTTDVPPIVANANILYVQAKAATVRNLIFDFYRQLFTGEDISVLSSHLFYGFNILEWAFAEEPFKIVWAIRDDGAVLSLTFLKEQELVAWTHGHTDGLFKSVCTVTEQTANGSLDAAYFVVQRVVNGNTVQYIERMSDIFYSTGLTDAWQVDAGLQYNGAATLSFTGAQHLAGMSVTGLATDDLGNVTKITPFTMATNGNFTLSAPTAPATGYTRVTVGLAYTCKLQTLPLDIGEPTVQGKPKKINSVVIRVADTLGLQIGQDFDNLYDIKDLVMGNVSSMLVGQASQIVTGLVTGDAREWLAPTFTIPGQYCIQQSNPYPATILGVIPDITIGEPGNGRR